MSESLKNNAPVTATLCCLGPAVGFYMAYRAPYLFN